MCRYSVVSYMQANRSSSRWGSEVYGRGRPYALFDVISDLSISMDSSSLTEAGADHLHLLLFTLRWEFRILPQRQIRSQPVCLLPISLILLLVHLILCRHTPSERTNDP